MKDCREIRSLLSDMIDGKIAADQQERVNQHLAVCPRCRVAFEELKRTVSLLKEVEPVEPPPWLEGRIMAHIAEEAAPRLSIWQRLVRCVSINVPLQAAAAIAVCITGYYLARTTSPQVDLSAPAGRIEQQTPVERKQAEQAPSPSTGNAQPSAKGTASTTSKPTERKKKLGGPSDAVSPQPTHDAIPSATERRQPSPLKEEPVLLGKAAEPKKEFSAHEANELPASGRLFRYEDHQLDGGTQPVGRQRSGALPASPPAAAPAAPVYGAMAEAPIRDEAVHHAKKAKKAASEKPLAITISAKDPASAGKVVTEIVKEVQGTVAKSDQTESSGSLTAKIDAARVPDFKKKLERVGQVQTKEMPTPDVSGPVLVTVEWK